MKHRYLFYTLIMVSAFSLSSCFQHFYKTNSVTYADTSTIQKLIAGNKYFIVHARDSAYGLANIKIENEKIEGNLDTLPEDHTKFLHPKSASGNRFPVKYKNTVLCEVHLYDSVSSGHGSKISLPIRDIRRLDVYGPDKSRTTGSAILSSVGIATTAGAAVLLILGGAGVSNTHYSVPIRP